MEHRKKFISPGAWFSLFYPADWNEFEDREESFLFYNPDNWEGNFRISAYKKDAKLPGAGNYAEEWIREELKENSSATRVKAGDLECAYSKEMYREGNEYYTSHTWITGIDNVVFECSFTVPKGGTPLPAEKIIESLSIRKEGEKYPAEAIPIRLAEIYTVNESYERIETLVKDLLKKDFQGMESDLPNLQAILDKEKSTLNRKDVWLALGIVLCVILGNEVEDMQWQTLIDGSREVPVLRYRESETLIDPGQLVWSKIKAGEHCDIVKVYNEAITGIELTNQE